MKQRDIFKRTKYNIIITSVSIVMVALLIFAVITANLYKSRVFKDVDQQIQTQRNRIIHDPGIIKHKGNQIREIVMPAPLTTNLISFVWLDGKLVDQSPHEYQGEDLYPNFEKAPKDQIFTLEDGDYTYRAVQFVKQGMQIQLLINVNQEIASVKTLWRILGLSFLILIVIVLMLASYLAVVVLRPLKIIYNKQVAFVQDASHEMRTPLAIIKGRLEILVRNGEDKLEKHYEELSSIMKEIRGLEKLTSDLLLMSKEDMGMKLEISKFGLNEFISEIGEFYTDFANMQEKELKINLLSEDISVNWDKGKVKRCVVILLENALKYTDRGDKITITVSKKDKNIKVQVTDTGIGIKEEEKDRIFDRFFRSSEVRASGREGSGIGLSLLKSIVYGLGGKVSLDSIYGEGSTFTLFIPMRMQE